MEEKTPDELKVIFRAAADIAGTVPESMQAVAFTAAVQFLSESYPRRDLSPRKVSPVSSRVKDETPTSNPGASIMDKLLLLDRTQYPKISSDRKAADLALLVLKAARDDAGVDGLTPAEVTRVLV